MNKASKNRFIRTMVDRANRQRINANLSMFERNSDAVLLDCGCSDGELTLEIAHKIGTGNIFGLDILLENVNQCNERGIKAYQHDLNTKLPFDNNSFDVVYAGDIIEHLSDTDMFVTEVYRVIKHGGYIVVSTNNLASCHNIIFLVAGRQPAPAAVSNKVVVGGWRKTSLIALPGPSHQRLFTLSALTGLFEYYGFHVERSKGSGFYPFPAAPAKILATICKNHSSHITIKASK